MPDSSRTLVLDFSASLYLGIVDPEGRVAASRIREQARGETAHGLLDEALAEAGIAPGDLSAIAIGIGPGSFTGIRVGVALAQGLAFARRLPLHPFSTLEAMRSCAAGAASAAGDSGDAGGRVVAAIAANAGRYYAALGDPPREAMATAEALLDAAAGGARLIVSGPLPERDREALAKAYQGMLRLEDSMDFARVARLALARPPVRDGVIRPNYLMASAAEEKRQAGSAGLPGGPEKGGAAG